MPALSVSGWKADGERGSLLFLAVRDGDIRNSSRLHIHLK